MALKLQSDIHKGDDKLTTLEADKTRTIDNNRDRLSDLKILYRFYNMRNQYSEEDKDAMGRDEVIQFGSSFEAAQNFITPIESMVAGTQKLIKFKLDTNNPYIDVPLSTTISKILSDGICNSSSKFSNIWTTMAGFCFIKAGGYVVNDDKDSGLFPRVADSMLFPASTELEPDKVRGCFEEIQMDINGIKAIIKERKDDEEDVKKLEELVEVLEKDIQGQSTVEHSSEMQLNMKSARYDNEPEKLSVWKYYEVRLKDSGERYVSSTLFATHNITGADHSVTILDDEEDIGRPDEWITMIFSDIEIGGEPVTDTMRGIGEAHFEPSMALEVLKNRQLDGAVISAVPIFQSDGQAGERIENGRTIKGNRAYKVYKPLDKMLLNMTKRVMTLELDADDSHTEDYNLIKLMQYKIDLAIIDNYSLAGDNFDMMNVDEEHLKIAKVKRDELSKEMFGTQLYYSVSANRNAIGLDRQQEKETGAYVMDSIQTGAIRGQQAKLLMKIAMTLITGDEDLADLAYQDTPIITVNQTHIAQAEWAVIMRRATSGEMLEINDTDDDEVHVINHMIDAISHTNRHSIDKWGQLDVMQFSIGMDHLGTHLERMRNRPETAGLVDKYFPKFQEIIANSAQIIKDVMQAREDESEDEEGSLEEEKMKADIQQTLVETEIMSRKYGLSEQEAARLDEQSKSRQQASNDNTALNQRRQLHGEISSAQKLELDKKKLNKGTQPK